MVADLDHAPDNNNPRPARQRSAHRDAAVRIHLQAGEVPNWYTAGETIEVTVTFSMPITVTGDPVFRFALSSPGITLRTKTVHATYTAAVPATTNNHGVPIHGSSHR